MHAHLDPCPSMPLVPALRLEDRDQLGAGQDRELGTRAARTATRPRWTAMRFRRPRVPLNPRPPSLLRSSRSFKIPLGGATPPYGGSKFLVGCPRMDVIDELVANNRDVAAGLPVVHLDVRPSRRLAIVTCMDSRLDVFAALGLRDGEAHVLRNAGGVITDDVIRSLAISQRRLGTREVMLIHHTDCGMQSLTDDGFRAELQHATGVAPAFAIESFTDLDADVRQSILRVRRSPFLPHRDVVRGFVYDVDSHRLTEIDVAD